MESLQRAFFRSLEYTARGSGPGAREESYHRPQVHLCALWRRGPSRSWPQSQKSTDIEDSILAWVYATQPSVCSKSPSWSPAWDGVWIHEPMRASTATSREEAVLRRPSAFSWDHRTPPGHPNARYTFLPPSWKGIITWRPGQIRVQILAQPFLSHVILRQLT